MGQELAATGNVINLRNYITPSGLVSVKLIFFGYNHIIPSGLSLKG